MTDRLYSFLDETRGSAQVTFITPRSKAQICIIQPIGKAGGRGGKPSMSERAL